uniref:eIF3a PCI domain-containing protein n=1 Tax=Peronospora matthiolae TaxID=2874970 RepID=A0AAV1USP2_9STRA
MWETYCTVLDILKSNSKLEVLYKVTAMQTFDFRAEYQRKIVFRRLCEIMRNHTSALQKHVATQASRRARCAAEMVVRPKVWRLCLKCATVSFKLPRTLSSCRKLFALLTTLTTI